MDEISQCYLDKYLETLDVKARAKYSSFSSACFCADEENANSCADLVRNGIKTATCSQKHWYESGGVVMPCAGSLQVVTNWDGEPTSIIEITSVSECKFCEVNEEHAYLEGEGDRSFESWRKVHWEFFSRECQEIGIEPSEDIMLVLERFQVVFS